MTGGEKRRLGLPARAYLWAAHRLYYELAWAYDPVSWLVSLGHWSEWRRQALAYVPGGRVLELAFGTGELLIEMALRGWQVCGLDLSPAMQRVTAHKMQRRGLWAPRLRANALALPFAAESLDAVVATFPAEYILAPQVWQEVARVLRPGGRFVVSGLFIEVESATLRRLTGWVYGPSRPGAVERLQALAQAAGLALTVHGRPGARVWAPVFVLEKPGAEPREGGVRP